jgi:8-oxo-dGTP diphosphatase
MIRRHGEPVRAGMRYRRRPGVYALLPRGDSLLVTHQAEPVPEFQLPGGGIDWHIGAPVRLGAFRRFTYMPEYDLWAEKLCTVYVARPLRRVGPPAEPGHTALWLPADEALGLLGNPGDRAMLAEWLRRA